MTYLPCRSGRVIPALALFAALLSVSLQGCGKQAKQKFEAPPMPEPEPECDRCVNENLPNCVKGRLSDADMEEVDWNAKARFSKAFSELAESEISNILETLNQGGANVDLSKSVRECRMTEMKNCIPKQKCSQENYEWYDTYMSYASGLDTQEGESTPNLVQAPGYTGPEGVELKPVQPSALDKAKQEAREAEAHTMSALNTGVAAMNLGAPSAAGTTDLGSAAAGTATAGTPASTALTTAGTPGTPGTPSTPTGTAGGPANPILNSFAEDPVSAAAKKAASLMGGMLDGLLPDRGAMPMRGAWAAKERNYELHHARRVWMQE